MVCVVYPQVVFLQVKLINITMLQHVHHSTDAVNVTDIIAGLPGTGFRLSLQSFAREIGFMSAGSSFLEFTEDLFQRPLPQTSFCLTGDNNRIIIGVGLYITS